MISLKLSISLLISIGFTLGSPLPQDLQNLDAAEERQDHGTNQDTLRLVTVAIRHGDRAPADTYPNDPYVNDSMKPYGWGQLTKTGRVNQYNQGIFLRNRYDKFLGSEYSPDVFWLQCTAVDRTKMSALLESAGLWQPDEEQAFKSDLPWQPVTLYYQPREEDTLLLVWDTCPKYAKERYEVVNLPEVQRVQKNNIQLYRELTNLTGMPIQDPDAVASLYGTLRGEISMNLTLPEWTSLYYPDKMIELMLYSLQMNTMTDELRRLKGGPFLKKIVTDMVSRKDDTLEPAKRKMFMYIGHDSTIVTLLDVMGVWNQQIPEYNLMTMIELHEDDKGWNVQLYLRNSTIHDPYPLTVPGCTTVCPLEDFIELLKPMIPGNWEEECKVEGDYTPPPAPPAR